MANQWFKFYGAEYLSDPKITSLSSTHRSCWITLLCYASVVNDNGNDNGVIRFLTEQNLMLQSGIDPTREEWKETEGVLKRFEKLSMIRLDDDMITILNWKKRQERSLTPYERVKRYREKKRSDNANDNDRIEENRIEENRIDTMFDEFWKEYPNKKAKAKAVQSFMKINPDQELFKEIMAGLEKAKQSSQWKKDGGQFIPHPTTWLNQERWNDEITANVPTRKSVKI